MRLNTKIMIKILIVIFDCIIAIQIYSLWTINELKSMIEFMKISDAAQKWGIGERRINTLCNEGRIPGAIKFGTTWALPLEAEKPNDARIKSGKYKKSK